MTNGCIRFGVVGVRGFSRLHIEWLERAVAAGGPLCLAAVATIEDMDGEEAFRRRLAGNGVTLVRDYAELLAMKDRVDVVTLPVGIHLHVPLALQALEAGFSVYMEKPVAGTCAEAAQLIAAEKRAPGRVLVGFQTMYQPATWELKRRLLDGAVGRVEKVVATVHWPRPVSYFRRNAWAGKVEYAGKKIFDSPVHNAAAHFLNTALFLSGAREEASATPVGAEAELYHANAIDSADSTFVRIFTREGVEVVFNGSLCVREELPSTIDVIGRKGRMRLIDGETRVLASWEEFDQNGVRRGGGTFPKPAELFSRVALAFLHSETPAVSTLETAAMHALAGEMAFNAVPVRPFPPDAVERIPWENDDVLLHVRGMGQTLETLRQGVLLPGEAGVAWSAGAGRFDGEKAAELFASLGLRGASL